MENSLTKPSYKYPLGVFIFVTTAVIVFLFLIDEDSHTLKGILKPAHIVTFFIYTIPTVLSQFLMYRLLTKLNIQSGKLFFSIIFGLFIGIVSVISILYLIK